MDDNQTLENELARTKNGSQTMSDEVLNETKKQTENRSQELKTVLDSFTHYIPTYETETLLSAAEAAKETRTAQITIKLKEDEENRQRQAELEKKIRREGQVWKGQILNSISKQIKDAVRKGYYHIEFDLMASVGGQNLLTKSFVYLSEVIEVRKELESLGYEVLEQQRTITRPTFFRQMEDPQPELCTIFRISWLNK